MQTRSEHSTGGRPYTSRSAMAPSPGRHAHAMPSYHIASHHTLAESNGGNTLSIPLNARRSAGALGGTSRGGNGVALGGGSRHRESPALCSPSQRGGAGAGAGARKHQAHMFERGMLETMFPLGMGDAGSSLDSPGEMEAMQALCDLGRTGAVC